MATIWGLNPNAAYAGAVGDVFVRTTNNEQLRWDGSVWVPIVPPETRADVAPTGGVLNQRLGKAAGRSFDLAWLNAADGVVMSFDQTTPSDEWQVNHTLSARFVDVQVFTPGNANPTAPQTIIYPEVTFDSPLVARLKFARPITGTAVVRR